jgi:hypothetical protein
MSQNIHSDAWFFIVRIPVFGAVAEHLGAACGTGSDDGLKLVRSPVNDWGPSRASLDRPR